MIAPGPQRHEQDAGPGGEETLLGETIGTVTASGMPLSTGLLAYAEEVPSRRMRLVLRKVSRSLDAGVPLDEALAETSRAASPYLLGLIRAGLATGRLGELLEYHLYCTRRTRAARSRVSLALAYPLLLLAVAAAVVLFMLVWPIPAFREIFNDFGVALPGITAAVIGVSDFVVGLVPVWPWVLGGLAVLIVLMYAVRFLPGRAARVRWFQYLPLAGSASRHVALSEFCSLLSILVESRVPLPDALRMTSRSLRDPNLAEGSRLLAGQVEEGRSAETAAMQLPHFPRSVAMLFRWQGRPEAFGRALRAAGELYAAQARVQIGVFGVFLQPLLLMFIVIVVGSTVVALFMPLVKLLNELA